MGSGPHPLKNHKNIVFLRNTGPDPLKMTKLPSQHSMSVIIGMLAKHHLNGVLLAGRWWPAYSVIWILSSKKNVATFDIPRQKFQKKFMTVEMLTYYNLEFPSLKGGCTGLSEPIRVKMPQCWKSHITAQMKGTQWLSGRVLDSRPRGRGLEPHRRHCVVSLSKTH